MSDKQDNTTNIETNGDDDLYGDLNVDMKNIAEKKKTTDNTSSTNNQRRHYFLPNDDGGSTAREENEMLKERIRTLEEENLILRRNIGTLFRTAKNEIQRKDGQINRLNRMNV
jgi:hypothetical protein